MEADPFTLLFSLVNSMLNPHSILISNLKKLSAIEETLSCEDKCLGCGISLEEIRQIGKMGCVNCYSIFKNQINLLLPQIQNGKIKHCGKKPSSKSVVSDLKIQMNNAIKQEKYEEAAILRDKIKELEKTVNSNDIESPESRVEENSI